MSKQESWVHGKNCAFTAKLSSIEIERGGNEFHIVILCMLNTEN